MISGQIIKASLVQRGEVVVAPLNLRDLAEQAAQIVLDARQQAAEILEQAQIQATSLRETAAEAARGEGYAEGLSQGRADGQKLACQEALAALDAESAELAQVARTIVAELSSASASMIERMRRQMLDLALDLAAKIVGEVSVQDISAARGNLEKVLMLCGRSGEVVVKANPQQLRRLQDYCAEFTAAMGLPGPVRLIGDESISPGGVRLLAGSGEIDATIETQLVNLAQSLVGSQGSLFHSGTYISHPSAINSERGEHDA